MTEVAVEQEALHRLRMRARLRANPMWLTPLLFGVAVAVEAVHPLSTLPPAVLLAAMGLVAVLSYVLAKRAAASFAAPQVPLLAWVVIVATIGAAFVIPRLAATASIPLLAWTGPALVVSAALLYFGWRSGMWVFRVVPIAIAAASLMSYAGGWSWVQQLGVGVGLLAYGIATRRALLRG